MRITILGVFLIEFFGISLVLMFSESRNILFWLGGCMVIGATAYATARTIESMPRRR